MVAGMVLEPAVLRSSFEAVTELLTCCGLGVFATRVGLLDAATTRALARCVFNIFLPAMLSTSVARTVASGASFSTLLPLPLCALVQVILGLGIVTLLLGGPKEVRTPAGRDVAALASFGNSGVLPLVFANCLFRSAPDLLARANSLVAMFLLGWSPLFWTLGYSLLAGRRGKHADGEEGEGEEDAVAIGPRSADEYWHELRKRVLTPPIMGCLAGIVVGAVPPLRALLVPAAGSATALFPLPLHRCIEAFGKAYSPAALLVLASSLALPSVPKSPEGTESIALSTPTGKGPIREIGTVLLTRFLLLPLAFAGLLGAAKRAGLLPPDPLRDFILLMQAAMPSAQNTVLALQVAGEPSRASRMARRLLVIYLAAALPVAVVLSAALQRSGLLAAGAAAAAAL